MFTKQHYEKVANTFHEAFKYLFREASDKDVEVPVAIDILNTFTDMFKRDNDNFNKTQFVLYVMEGLPEDDVEWWDCKIDK